MDYRNNPRTDRKRLLEFIEEYIEVYLGNNEPHEEPIRISAPEIELSPDSLDLYNSYSSFLSANRRKLIEDFSKIIWPCGMIIQLEIDYEARVCISYANIITS